MASSEWTSGFWVVWLVGGFMAATFLRMWLDWWSCPKRLWRKAEKLARKELFDGE